MCFQEPKPSNGITKDHVSDGVRESISEEVIWAELEYGGI